MCVGPCGGESCFWPKLLYTFGATQGLRGTGAQYGAWRSQTPHGAMMPSATTVTHGGARRRHSEWHAEWCGDDTVANAGGG